MVTSFVKFLLNPFNLLWLLSLVSVLAWYFKKRKPAKWLLYITGILFILSSTPLVPGLLINSLENSYDPLYIDQLPDTSATFHIVVLGGGHALDDRLPANALLSHKALGRLNEGIRLHRQLPNSKLVFSGFSGSGGTTQAEMLQKTALLLGIPKEETLLQNEPSNTFEEAKRYKEKFGDTYPVLLVTNATHMPRALHAFNRFKIDVIPAPTNFRLKGSWKHKWFGLPSMSNIENTRVALYEYAGMFQYAYLK